MFSTVFNSETVYVLDDAPNWATPVGAKFEIKRDLQTGLTKRESRRPYSSTLLTSMEYTVVVQGASLRVLQASLRAINAQRVIVPFWPARCAWADRGSNALTGGLCVAWKADWSQFEIYTAEDDEPAWPAAEDYFAPALMGFIAPAELRLLTADVAEWMIAFQESSPAAYCLTPAEFTPASGPTPTGYAAAPALLPFHPDFTTATEHIAVDVKRNPAGFTREQTSDFYPHTPFRSQTLSYTLAYGQDAEFLRFFMDHAGLGAAFWSPGRFCVAALTQDAAASDTVLHVEDTAAVNVGDYLFCAGAFGKVASKTADTITLLAAMGVGLSKFDGAIYPLCLGRSDASSIEMRWLTIGVATAELAWTEQRPELTIPGNETLGVTLGRLPQRAVLFQFVRDYGNDTVVNSYATNFESDITYSGHTWSSLPVVMDDINKTLNLEDDSAAFNASLTKPDGTLFASLPFIADIAAANEVPLGLKVWFADYDGTTVTNAVKMFDGECASFSRTGNKLKVTAKVGSSLFETMLPLMVRGRICNHIKGSNFTREFLISAGCSLLAVNWKFTATVASPVDDEYPFQLHVAALTRSSGAAPTYFADWFALGRVEWGAGANIQRRSILSSTLPISGAMVLTLNKFFTALPNVGDSVVLYPGCPGTMEACKAYNAISNVFGKFDNFLNFGNNPFTPMSDPSLVGQQDLSIQGGKK